MKTCKCCNENKELVDFYKKATGRNGLCSYCKSCDTKKRQAYLKTNPKKVSQRRANLYKKHKEKIKKANAEYVKKNFKKVSESRAKHRIKNKDRIYEKIAIWRKQNPGKVNAKVAMRNAIKIRATPKWLTPEQLKEIEEIYIICKEIQWLSEEPLTVDHIIPLQGKTVCGFHHPDNLRIITRSENSRKSNKLLEELL